MAIPLCAACLATFALAAAAQASPAAPTVSVSGDWQVRVSAGTIQIGGKPVPVPAATLTIVPAVEVSVKSEKHDSLPVFESGSSGWTKGTRLRGVEEQEVTAQGALVPGSVILTSAPNGGETYVEGKDYALDEDWGTFGRLPGSRIGEGTPIYVSYRYGLGRIDSLVVNRKCQVSVRPGSPAPAPPPSAGFPKAHLPQMPSLRPGEARLANVWVPARLPKLSADNLFPILETAYPEPPPASLSVAEQRLPVTLRKLRSGEPLKILAWGDSVTDGIFLPSPEDRWQAQFIHRLRARFPKANITLVTVAWGGRNTQRFLDEPPGSPHNYREAVLGAKPDLIVSEFVNDGGLSPELTESRYGRFLEDFQGIGAEWIILSPHYVTPAWMGLTREKDIDDDPRPYVTGLRRFAAAHPAGLALADASLRWGRLWRQGIPYTTLLGNSVNHPDPRGQTIFVDSLLALFP